MDPSSVVVVGGRPPVAPGGPLNQPVVLSSTYHAGGQPVYGRDDNPSWEGFEEVVGALEGGSATAFASGLGAVAAVIETLPVGATVVVAGDAYNGTRRLLADVAARGRLHFVAVDVSDTAATLAACAGLGSGLLWLESPTNPLLAIADLAPLITGARQAGLAVAVDNTFATPLLQQPLALGADVVVHSATKLLAGHTDVVMGVAVAADPVWHHALRLRRGLHGAIPGPFEAWLALRGLRTLALRVDRGQASAAVLADRLAEHPAVDRVRYPGRPDHPGHSVAARQMRGFGTMLSFDVHGGAGVADGVCAAVRLAVHTTSLGGVETLLERRGKYATEAGTPPSLIRLSVGIEHVEDLWSDLDQALRAATG
jgi:cystathionine gamma-synthase